jgi:uncharacterized protein YjiS (DUF1127 family)
LASHAPFDAPAYPLAEAAHCLALPPSTLRSWILGRDYETKQQPKRFQPVVEVAQRSPVVLSFRNLVEAHVLSAIRREHEIPLRLVRRAIRWLKQRRGTRYPLSELAKDYGRDLREIEEALRFEIRAA